MLPVSQFYLAGASSAQLSAVHFLCLRSDFSAQIGAALVGWGLEEPPPPMHSHESMAALTPLSPTNVAWIRRVYREDVELHERHCGERA